MEEQARSLLKGYGSGDAQLSRRLVRYLHSCPAFLDAEVRFSYRNPREADFLMQILHQFFRKCRPQMGTTVGIITPYRAQVELFEDLLKKAHDRVRSCTSVATVDGFQGNERLGCVQLSLYFFWSGLKLKLKCAAAEQTRRDIIVISTVRLELLHELPVLVQMLESYLSLRRSGKSIGFNADERRLHLSCACLLMSLPHGVLPFGSVAFC